MRVADAQAIARALSTDTMTLNLHDVQHWSDALWTLACAAPSPTNVQAFHTIADHINAQSREAYGAEWAVPYDEMRAKAMYGHLD